MPPRQSPRNSQSIKELGLRLDQSRKKRETRGAGRVRRDFEIPIDCRAFWCNLSPRTDSRRKLRHFAIDRLGEHRATDRKRDANERSEWVLRTRSVGFDDAFTW